MDIKSLAINYVSLFLLLFLTADALIANWTLNPIWDLLYARVQSSFFNNVHASSMLSICVACFYLILRNGRKEIPLLVSVCFATASIHELTLALVDTAIGSELPQGVSLQYGIYLSIFLIIAIWKGNPFHRRILALQVFILLGVYTLDIVLSPGSTILGNKPSPFFYNPLTNAVEVFSWLLPAALWFLPPKWVEQLRLLPARS